MSKNIRNFASKIETKIIMMYAHYFADKAQKQIDALWENGTINEQTIEAWGNERMRTPYRHAVEL